jgi:hypothetical protein
MYLFKKQIWLTAALLLTLTACGGGGGGSSVTTTGTTTDTTASGKIDGYAVAAPISAGTVRMFELKEIGAIGTDILGSTVTAVDGSFELDMTGLSGNFVVEITGGTYLDEATGNTITNTRIRGMIFDWEEGKGPFVANVTPLTELGFQIATSLRPDDLQTAFRNAAIFAGGIRIDTTRPQALSENTSGSRNELEYGAALAAMSQLAVDQGYGSLDATLTALVADFSDGSLNGTGQSFITAFEAFLASTQNQSAFETTETAIPTSVNSSKQSVMPIDNLVVVDCARTSCSQPSVQGLSVRSDVAKPFPPFCDNTIGNSCVGEYLTCYGNTCLVYTDPLASGNHYSSVCKWFYDYDIYPSLTNLCPGGRELRYARELALIPCSSPSSGARNDGSCPRDGRITLVVPSDTNLKGALFVHDGSRLVTTGGANGHHPFKARRLVSDFSNNVDADCTQVGADAQCYQLLDVFMDPAWLDVGSHTLSMLTTYGYEWDVPINVPDGTHMICNIMNGQCAEKINSGAEGEVKVTLSWQTALRDMDVYLTDPCGNKIFFGSSSQTCNTLTGELDVDDVGNGALLENIAYPDGAPAGDYVVEIDNYSGIETIAYTVKIIFGTNVEIHQGSIGAEGLDSYSFTLVK